MNTTTTADSNFQHWTTAPAQWSGTFESVADCDDPFWNHFEPLGLDCESSLATAVFHVGGGAVNTTDANEPQVITGTIIITKVSITNPALDVVKFTANFRGQGPFAFAT